MTHRTRVFISYSHRDIKHLGRLQVHLAPYVRDGLIDYWDDTRIGGGARWEHEIEEAIDSALVAIVLVSADFLASPYINDKELPRLIHAARHEGVIILPVIVGPCAFTSSVLAGYQLLNVPTDPLNGMRPSGREEVWARAAAIVARALGKARVESPSPTPLVVTEPIPPSRDLKSPRHAPSSRAIPHTGKQPSSPSEPIPAENDARTAGSASTAPRTIIIADDLDYVRTTVVEILETEVPGYTFVQVDNGLDVLRLIEQITPALLIMDVIMPGRDGFTILERLADRRVRFPIVLMSGDSWVQRRLFTAMDGLAPNLIPGQVRTISKPFDLDELCSLVHELLPVVEP